MRRMTVPIVLLLSGCLFAACGKGGHGTTAAHTAAAAPGPAKSNAPPTRSEAVAFAHAVNLTAADVPGFSVSSEHAREHETAAEKRLRNELLRCMGVTAGSGNGLANVNSAHFELKHSILDLSVQSAVSVARTSASATNELAEIRSPRVRVCLSHYLDQLFRSLQSVKANIGPVSIQHGNPPAPGTTGGFGWRITAPIMVRRIPVPFYMDILGFVYGPANITLVSIGLVRPFPATAEQHLFSLLVERAKAHRV